MRHRTDTRVCSKDTAVFAIAPTWKHTMLETIVILLLVLWALGLVTSFTMGGLIHVLLVVAVVVVLLRVIRGRSPF